MTNETNPGTVEVTEADHRFAESISHMLEYPSMDLPKVAAKAARHRLAAQSQPAAMVQEMRREALRQAADLVFRIEAAGALEYERTNFERWKEVARRIAPKLRAALTAEPGEHEEPTAKGDRVAGVMREYFEAHKRDKWDGVTADNLMIGLLNIALREYRSVERQEIKPARIWNDTLKRWEKPEDASAEPAAKAGDAVKQLLKTAIDALSHFDPITAGVLQSSYALTNLPSPQPDMGGAPTEASHGKGGC